MAEVYINNEYYGYTIIQNRYEEYILNELLNKSKIDANFEIDKGYEYDYYPVVVTNYWKLSDELYVPYLKFNIKNVMSVSANRIIVKVVFIDESDRSIWGEYSYTVIGYSNTPLRTGYIKEAFITGSVGYYSRLDEEDLPNLRGDVYINDELYGSVNINKTYEYQFINEELELFEEKHEKYIRETDDDFLVFIRGNYWKKGQRLYTPHLKIDVTNQNLIPVNDITIKTVFYDVDDTEIWSEEKNNLITSSNIPLRYGYKKTAFVSSGVGYESRLDEDILPNLIAEIFVNDKSYGIVNVEKSYDDYYRHYELVKKENPVKSNFKRRSHRDFFVLVEGNYWEKTTSYFSNNGGIYAPKLKLKVINQLNESAEELDVKVAFYDEDNKKFWDEQSSTLVSHSSEPLPTGFGKTAFIHANLGYTNKIPDNLLPKLIAEVYINEKYYGYINVKKTYAYKSSSDPLLFPINNNVQNNSYSRKNKMDFYVKITGNCWNFNAGIYAPFVRMDITNQKMEPANSLILKYIIYDDVKKEIWYESSSTLIYSSDLPLKPGYKKTGFIKSGIGYKNKIDIENLPDLTVDIYINDDLYGSLKINNTYDDETFSYPLVTIEEVTSEKLLLNEKSFLGAMGYSTRKGIANRHSILALAAEEYGKQRVLDHLKFLINIRVAQIDGAYKFRNAISIWKDDIEFVKSI